MQARSHATLFTPSPVQVVSLPFIPAKVSFADLDADYRLISASEVIRLKQAGFSDGHICKSTSGAKYVLAKHGDTIYAIYHGKSKELGDGSFGKVKLAQHIETGEWFAYKVVTGNWLQAEADILARLDKAPVVNGQPVSFDYHSKSNRKKVHGLLMHYASGINFRDSRLGFYIDCSHQVLSIVISLFRALQKIHSKDIQHQDVNSRNELIDITDNHATIIDFGLSSLVGRHDSRLTDVSDLLTFINNFLTINQWLQETLSPKLKKWIEEIRIKSFADESIKRIHLDNTYLDIINGLQALRAGMPAQEKTYTIQLLDVSAEKPHHSLTHALIWLVDTKGTATEGDYLRKRHALEQGGHVAGDKVYKHTSIEQIIAQVRTDYAKRLPDCELKVVNAATGAEYTQRQPLPSP